MYVITPGLCIVSHDCMCLVRVQKLKDARTQATKEIEEYRKSKEQEFKAFEASVRPNYIYPTFMT